MPKKIIKVRVTPDGALQVDTVVNGGKTCLSTIKTLASHMGGDIDAASVRKTVDFHKKVDNKNDIEVR